MTTKEPDNLSSKIEELQIEIRKELGLDKISGGFVDIKITDYDGDSVLLTVKDGVQSDCENRVNTWQTSIDRKTFKRTR
tara:strand:- start:602 stop:838 length:237 start_codon:yes stop_codon:yes gene_type:complete